MTRKYINNCWTSNTAVVIIFADHDDVAAFDAATVVVVSC